MFSHYNLQDADNPELRALIIRHMNGADILINLLDDPTVLMKQIEHVANQHAVIDGFKPIHFTVSLSLVSINQSINQSIYIAHRHTGWRRSVVVSALASINVVNRHWARLVLGWVTACGWVNHLGM